MLCRILIKLLLFVQFIGAFAAVFETPGHKDHGNEASMKQFPHQVSLRLTQDSKHFCGGAILSDHWIVTAAQCTQGPKSTPENIFIVAGLTYISNKGVTYELEKVINHPGFDWDKRQNDISMLKTNRQIQLLDNSVFPINLPSFKIDYEIEQGIGLIPVIISGWGTIHAERSSADSEDESSSEMLRSQKSYILNRNSCRRYLGRATGKYLNMKHLCTSVRDGEGMCIGDVGSPLISENGEIVGIESWRSSSCELGYPDVHTRVFPHLNWIWGHLLEQENE